MRFLRSFGMLAMLFGIAMVLMGGALVKSLPPKSDETERWEGIAGFKNLWVSWDENLPRFFDKSIWRSVENVTVFSAPPNKEARFFLKHSLGVVPTYVTRWAVYLAMRPDRCLAATILGLIKNGRVEIFSIHKTVITVNIAINSRCSASIFDSYLACLSA